MVLSAIRSIQYIDENNKSSYRCLFEAYIRWTPTKINQSGRGDFCDTITEVRKSRTNLQGKNSLHRVLHGRERPMCKRCMKGFSDVTDVFRLVRVEVAAQTGTALAV